MFFGGGGYGQGDEDDVYSSVPQKGANLKTQIALTLEEAYSGVRKIIDLGTEKIRLSIKPGIRDGQILKIAGKGKQASRPGDLFVTIQILPHSFFVRKDNDLHCRMPIDISTAVLGGKINVKTLGGQISINVPPETENGKTFRALKLGMPDYDNPRLKGNLYVKVFIQVPKNLSAEEKELYRKLGELRK